MPKRRADVGGEERAEERADGAGRKDEPEHWRIDAEVASQVEDEDRGLRAEEQDEDRAGRNERAQDGMAEQGGQTLADLRAHVAGSRDDQRLRAPDER